MEELSFIMFSDYEKALYLYGVAYEDIVEAQQCRERGIPCSIEVSLEEKLKKCNAVSKGENYNVSYTFIRADISPFETLFNKKKM